MHQIHLNVLKIFHKILLNKMHSDKHLKKYKTNALNGLKSEQIIFRPPLSAIKWGFSVPLSLVIELSFSPLNNRAMTGKKME